MLLYFTDKDKLGFLSTRPLLVLAFVSAMLIVGITIRLPAPVLSMGTAMGIPFWFPLRLILWLILRFPLRSVLGFILRLTLRFPRRSVLRLSLGFPL